MSDNKYFVICGKPVKKWEFVENLGVENGLVVRSTEFEVKIIPYAGKLRWYNKLFINLKLLLKLI